MSSATAALLNHLGLYRPLKRVARQITDPRLRRRRREIGEDLARTRRAVGAWSRTPLSGGDNRRLFGIVSFTDLPLHAKFQALLAKAMELEGYSPLAFTYSGCRFGHEYLRLFGCVRLVEWDRLVQASSWHTEAEQWTDVALTRAGSASEVLALTFRGVQVGKHAMSTACRKLLEGQIDFNAPEIRRFLRGFLVEAVESTLLAGEFLDANPVEKLLVRDPGYLPNGPIFETALARGVDCVAYEQGQRRGTWILKRYSPASRGRHYFSLEESTWQQIRSEEWSAEDDAALEAQFAGRYRPDSVDDTRRLMTGKSEVDPDAVREALGLDAGRKTAVLFSHIAWDAAFFYGSCLFEDYESWLYETVKSVAAHCPEMNWVVKLHPFNLFKLKREGGGEESELRLLRNLMPLPPHVRLLRADTPISTRSLFAVTDYVLTVNGTVGMEFPCYGIPAVVAGTGRYEGRGFTLEPRSVQEYFDLLQRLHTLPRLSPEAVTAARQHFLALTTRRQFPLDDVARMELKRMNEAESDVHDNIHLLPRSLEEFGSARSVVELRRWLAHSDSPDLLAPADLLASAEAVP
jgi:hypothetical protein